MSSDKENGDDLQQNDSRGENPNEQELASKTVQIQSKRFYLDVKENHRGRFLKIAEVGPGGRKSRVTMSMSVAADFREVLTKMSEHSASLGTSNPNAQSANDEGGRLRSETIVRDSRRYYLDLKENQRGRFLRVSMTSNRGGMRNQIAIPAQGLIEFADRLSELVDQFGGVSANGGSGPGNSGMGTGAGSGMSSGAGGNAGSMGDLSGSPTNDDSNVDLPASKYVRVENKNFYFDVGSNSRGVFLRVSEVTLNFRSAITVPEKAWRRVHESLGQLIEDLDKARLASGKPAPISTSPTGEEEAEVEAREGGEGNCLVVFFL